MADMENFEYDDELNGNEELDMEGEEDGPNSRFSYPGGPGRAMNEFGPRGPR